MHRREAIMQAVITAVTGLATTGAQVARRRIHQLPPNVTAALSVYQGSDAPLPEPSIAFLDTSLTVAIDAHARAASSEVETRLNQIALEVTAALHAAAWPAYVIDIEEGEAAAPEVDGSGEKPVGTQRLAWRVRYRRARTDPSS